MPDFASLAQPALRALRADEPGHDIVALRQRFPHGLCELGSNENPLGPSPCALEAVRAALPELHRYPDPLGGELRAAIAASHGLRREQVLLGNGSHELLMQLAQAFAGPGAGVVASEFGFAVYAIAARAAGANFTAAPALSVDAAMPRGHDLAAIASAVSTDSRLVYLCNPNNPTGTWFGSAGLRSFLARLPSTVLVVVDEAYLEYVDDPGLESALGLLAEFPNLIVTRTFSKAFGLAGLRVGYACAHPALLAVLDRLRESFNVGIPGLVGARAALSDHAHLARARAANAAERTRLAAELSRRGLRVAPSQTNFLLVDFSREAAPVEAALVANGIVLRPMIGYRLPNCLRITVGTREDNDRFLSALDEVIA
ncbi:MAG: histidinol-phosphate transaminase [Arenimonas sp.]